MVTAAVSLITCLCKKNPDDFKTCISLAVSRLSRVSEGAVTLAVGGSGSPVSVISVSPHFPKRQASLCLMPEALHWRPRAGCPQAKDCTSVCFSYLGQWLLSAVRSMAALVRS